MIDELCADCLDLQATVLAVRILPSGKPLCDSHWRARLGMKPAGSPTISTGPKKIAAQPQEVVMERKNIDWDAVQRDRDAGIRVSELVEKYGVANPTIYKNTNGGAKKARVAAGKKVAAVSEIATRPPRDAKPKPKNEAPEAAGTQRWKLDVSEEFLDACWNGLPPEKKATLLSKLD